MPPKRMTANPARPARHRPGKPTHDESSSSSSSGDESDEATQKPAPARKPPPKAISAGKIISVKPQPSQADQEAARKREREAVERMAAEAGFVTESEDEDKGAAQRGDQDSEEESSEEGDDESSEEESSEDEKPRLMLRPKFIPKSQRAGYKSEDQLQREHEAQEARKKAEMDALVEEQIKLDLASSAAAKKHWEDSDDQVGSDGEGVGEVDDTDGLDPEAERAAFKLRKLKRYKRDREAMLAREAEIEELERRRNLTEEERRAEDEERIRRQEAEREEKKSGAQGSGFMRKYFHGGAFYREEAEKAGLEGRDVMGARFVDEMDRSTMPAYLQRRDMTQVGRKGATKYKDLRSEDTGRWGDFEGRDGRGGGAERGFGGRFDGDERFRPDWERERGGEGEGAKGANAIPLGERKGVPAAPSGPREDKERYGERERGGGRERDRSRGSDRDRDADRRRHRDRDDYRSRDDDRHRRKSRSMSRSRSPRRRDSRERHHRRKRSTSREGHYEADKRRRVDTR